MISTLVNLLCIAIICVIVTDLTDFFSFVKSVLSRILTSGRFSSSNWTFKILDCSLCQTHWLGLIYLIITQSFSIPMYTYVLFISLLTPVIGNLITFLLDSIQKIFYK